MYPLSPERSDLDAAPEFEQDQDTLWEVLLQYIEEGTVIPVVGRDLLKIEKIDQNGDVRETLLYSELARELARVLSVSVDPEAFAGPNPLGAVASDYIVSGRPPNHIYRFLPTVFSRVNQQRVPRVPEALKQLAEITPFRIFLTTTFDPMLADCLGAVRSVEPMVMAYARDGDAGLTRLKVGENKDRTLRILKDLPAPTVVHILGKLSNTPNYVVTEEDAFEFVYSLQETRPESLMDLLAQMKLLIIGCRFPSWIVRYFLRTARRRRLLQTGMERTDFVVDAGAAEDAALVQFLRNFRTQTEIFTRYTPAQFVEELHRRWSLRAHAGQDPSTDALTPCSILVSYASEDSATAARVADQIRAAQLPVWLDSGRLGAGDDWERKIRRNIELAAAVVPIISRSSRFRGGREFRREWAHALHVKSGLPANEAFIYPLVVDDVPRDSEEIDPRLRAIDWEEIAGDDRLPARFIERLRAAFRQAQLRGMR